jgi:hypothetical protein
MKNQQEGAEESKEDELNVRLINDRLAVFREQRRNSL